MGAHDVRNLRYCDTCHALGWKDEFLEDGPRREKRPSICVACAYKAAGSLEAFTARYDRAEWGKLPLDLIGGDAMSRLLDLVKGG